MHKLISLLFVIFIGYASFAQDSFVICGQVVDSSSMNSIDMASILLKDSLTDQVISGTKTTEDGKFEIGSTNRNFRLEVRAVGYYNLIIDTTFIAGDSMDLGMLRLSSKLQLVEQMEVRAEKSTTEFHLDKRVFNVGQDLSSSGASALEVLNNVPSVTVSLEGIISLRGASGVQILIDGKPSVMADDANGALGTITADMIEKIEVITNPSANYESEGTSGIINIILKKEEKKGINGSVSINTGWPHNHSIGFSMNYRTEKFNLFTQLGAGYRSLPRYSTSINQNKIDSTIINSEGLNYRNEKFYNVIIGSDYYINKYNTMTLSGNFAFEDEEQPSTTHFKRLYYDQLIDEWERTESTQAGNPKYRYDLQYKKEFKDTSEHTLLFSTLGQFFGKDQSSVFTNRGIFGTSSYPLQRTATNFKESNFTFKLDYNHPLNKKFTIATGAQYIINDVGNDFEVQDEVGTQWVTDSSRTNNFEFSQNVLGVYGTGSYENDKWGLKLGLRVENTDLKTRLVTTNESNNRFYTNLFPTLHTSYKISRLISIQAGYSRRIFRPRLWDLNPFFNISNNFNVRKGNPFLMPEFTDSYELMSIFIWEKLSLNTGVYYRYTTDVVERVSTFENNVNTVLPMNIGTNQMTGLELNIKYTPLKWWTLMTDGNFNYFNRKGTFENQVFDFTGNKWTGKIQSKFKITKNLDLELTGNYASRFVTVQGEEAQQVYLDGGVRYKILKGKGVFNLGARDIFASRISRTTINQEDFYLNSESTRGRFLTFGFSYGFGKGEAMTYSGGRR